LISAPIIGWYGPPLVLLLASLLALCVTAISLHLLLRTGLVRATSDQANERSLHQGNIPRIGGIGIALGLSAALVAALLVHWPLPAASMTIVTCYTMLLSVSLFDDVYRLPVAPRLLIQVAVALAAAAALGLGAIGVLVCALLLVWCANLYNFMDGSDGLAGGMTVIGFACYALIAFLNQQLELAVLCATIASAAVGFLYFNLHPARLFLGDSGSIPLGFTAGLVGIIGWQQTCWPWWLPIIVFFPFIFDASFTLLHRILKREAFWQPHRQHLYQRSILAGLGHYKLALFEYLLMFASSALAVLIIHKTSAVAGLIIGLQTVTGLFFAWRAHQPSPRETKPLEH
jgi:UDP-N-acetylmuramyl pentapeptide phosphotransferase/UDP-N-acetylglucosamine-1-phosphate transferase